MRAPDFNLEVGVSKPRAEWTVLNARMCSFYPVVTDTRDLVREVAFRFEADHGTRVRNHQEPTRSRNGSEKMAVGYTVTVRGGKSFDTLFV